MATPHAWLISSVSFLQRFSDTDADTDADADTDTDTDTDKWKLDLDKTRDETRERGTSVDNMTQLRIWHLAYVRCKGPRWWHVVPSRGYSTVGGSIPLRTVCRPPCTTTSSSSVPSVLAGRCMARHVHELLFFYINESYAWLRLMETPFSADPQTQWHV